VASTRTGVLALGVLGKDLGTVEPGKVADLVVVGADPTANVANLRNARYVVRGGVVHSIRELTAAGR
jgi:imidazolonepropionase-like amidohydrolase